MAGHFGFLIRLLAITASLLALGSGGNGTSETYQVKRERRHSGSGGASPDAVTTDRVREQYGRLPLSFERNEGQTDPRVEFISRGSGYTMFLTRGAEAVVVLSGAALRLTLAGGDKHARAHGRNELPGKVNYLRGPDRKQWRTGIATVAKVAYDNIYPGIDIVYYGNQRQLEYDFIVRPGADPRTIALDVDGADSLAIDAQGELVMSISGRQLRQQKPIVYQESGGVRTEVAGRYTIANRRVGFQLGAYDASLPLVIDPVLVYSTFLGGAAGALANDSGADIAVDVTGSAYLTGETTSPDFPVTAGAFDTTANGQTDAFVTKLDPAGATLLYSTYLGGRASADAGRSIAIDPAGSAYVTGHTQSWDFPTTPAAFDRIFNGGASAFVTKLDPTGAALAYSTYLGNAGITAGEAIVVDASGSAYVTGSFRLHPLTDAGVFPTTPGAFDTTFNSGPSPLPGARDAFVTKFDAAGAALIYSTFLGGGGSPAIGGGDDQGLGIAVDATGNAYVTGSTSSMNFPTTAGAFDTSANGGADVFVTKLDGAGAALAYSTYLGGSATDSGAGIAIDAGGNAHMTGSTSSPDFPATAAGFDTSWNGFSDAFVTKVNSTGAGLLYSTYLGGESDDSGNDISLDATGNAYVTGSTSSATLPTTAGAFDTSVEAVDAFVAKLAATGSALVYSTYLGGGCGDRGEGVALDAGNNAYVTGATCSTDFPTTPGAYDTSLHGQNPFVTKMNPAGTALVYSTFVGGDFLPGGEDEGGDIAVDRSGSAYVTGTTTALDFPTTSGAFDPTPNSANARDVFVTKLDAAGAALVYSTYLGGSDHDGGRGIAVDASGSAYITGFTGSRDFPTTAGAFDVSLGGGWDVFVAKLDPAGAALVYSTYLGGISFDGGRDIAVDESGNAYVTGNTATDFPTTPGAFDTIAIGGPEAFVTKLDAAGAALVYSTYLGGFFSSELPSGIAIDASGSAYVTGVTDADDFPITAGAFDTDFNGGQDVYLTKLDPAGAALIYSTYLGGSSFESTADVAIDVSGNAYVTGTTDSTDFPTTAGAFDAIANGSRDAFVTKLDAAGAALIYSTYLGGSSDDSAAEIDVGVSGNAHVTGNTMSANFPTTAGAVDRIWNGASDAFVTRLDTAGTAVDYSTFLGGFSNDSAVGLALDPSGNIYVTGTTFSFNFPTTAGAYDRTLAPPADVFVANIAALGQSALLTLAPQSDTNPVGQPHCLTANLRDSFGNPLPGVVLRFMVTGAVNTTGSATTFANGNTLFCYAGSPIPGEDTIAALADFDNNSQQDPGEPTASASKTWELPSTTPTCGAVQGQGLLLLPGRLAAFGLNVSQDGASVPHGEVSYTDFVPVRNLESTAITRLIITGNMATIHGEGRVNGGVLVPFRVDVSDGILDTFRIVWPGYSAQSFVFGQIAIRPCG